MSGFNTSTFFKGISLLIVGGVIGSAVFMFIFQHNFGQLVAENNILHIEKIELTEDLDQLRKNEKKYNIIKQIDARLQLDTTTQFTTEVQEELEKKVRDGLKIVYAQKITTAKDNALVYEKLISTRNPYNVFDKNYTVTVHFFALIGTELTVWFSAKEIRLPNPAS